MLRSRSVLLCLTLSLAVGCAQSQTPLSRDEALKQLYPDYDPVTKKAHWICTKGQLQADHQGWPCSDQYAKVSLSVELSTQVVEHGTEKNYLVTSALPVGDPRDFECHMCAPGIGIAVFALSDGRWTVESSNAGVGFYGSYGGPPMSELVAIGPDSHGVILSSGDSGQGYHGSMKHLLAAVGKTINEVWQLRDEQDDSGAFDPNDKLAQHRLYYSEAAFKFVYVDNEQHYDIIAMSRGTDDRGKANWTRVFRFRDGRYQLLRTTSYVEAKAQQKRSKRLPSSGPE